MRCPACQGPTTAVQTIPAEKRSDGRVYRYRRCKDANCNTTCSTLEILRQDVGEEDNQQEVEARKSKKVAIPAMAPGSSYDLEGELDKGLPLAVEVLIDAVRPGTSPDKIKLDAAKWLLEDRRRWRIGIAEHAAATGQTPADPAVAQLATILKLVGE